ncbi:hypothetical protein C823_005528 [Eubacterium plexicaudatum ASF492]|nr:hypothetical protein C823_005528 [Eubacterium plexicaudatum ASF492]
MAIITHNLMAMNTDRQLGIVSESKKKIRKNYLQDIELTVRQMMRPDCRFRKK